jgi:hypothetical protein
MKYKVIYTETQSRSIVVEATSKDDAESMVYHADNDIDFGESVEEDSTIVSVDEVRHYEQQ